MVIGLFDRRRKYLSNSRGARCFLSKFEIDFFLNEKMLNYTGSAMSIDLKLN